MGIDKKRHNEKNPVSGTESNASSNYPHYEISQANGRHFKVTYSDGPYSNKPFFVETVPPRVAYFSEQE